MPNQNRNHATVADATIASDDEDEDDEEWRPENDAIVLLKSRITVHDNRYLVMQWCISIYVSSQLLCRQFQ